MFRLRNVKETAARAPDRSAAASDAELVHAARRGNKQAFVEIVARHQAMVCGIALGILGDFAASEDAAQEAFLTAWRKFHELREPERLRAWLAQIARNAALGQLRRRRGLDPLEDAPMLADDSPTPDEAAAREEEAALVRDSLARLPEPYRLPLVLFYREGQSVRAVAEALELSEDAVKQRLARGREMLRERMSGLIETVLTRTGPTAIFTMTIAAAIGALTAPAAVAGTVFSAASVAAGATTTSSASSTSFLTAMSTSKAFLFTAAVVTVACIPIGYRVAAGKPTPPPSRARSPVAVRSPAAPAESVPTFEGGILFAEWRALHEKYGTNADAMPVLYQAIGDLPDAFRRRAFRSALISEWVQVDPQGGLKFILGKGPDRSQRRQFVDEWLTLDARGAVDGLLAGTPGWGAVAREVLPEIARRVPARLPEVVARLPEAEDHWDTNVRDAFAILTELSLDTARTSAEAMTGPNRNQALAGVAKAWAQRDFDVAVAWAKGLPDGTDRNEIIRAALIGRAAVDPAGALDSVQIVPSGGRQAYFGDTTGARVLQAAAQADFDGTMAWLAAHPGRMGFDDLEGLSHLIGDRLNMDVAGFLNARVADGSLTATLRAIDNAMLNNAAGQRTAVWDWLKTQPDNEATRSLKQSVLNSAGYQDPALALRLVNELPATPEGDALMLQAARALFNGGQRLDRYNQLIAQASDRMRPKLLDAAFDYIRVNNLEEAQLWAARVPLLPDASRAKGIESLARAWASQTPEEAVNWVNSLAAGDARNGAAAAVAASWAAKDPTRAAGWVASLPPGPERDRSAGSLASTIARSYPREAWDWVVSISDTSERTRAATQTLKVMAARDPATARQWIETGPFTAETKDQLRAALAPAGNPSGAH